ncbi:DUF4157 domain-containing protein [Aquimarina litoralis]|uniref:eCIS core domain-containing protein n=1 Tax=Aquimarina litoralis TaxID=584605 RepID=UPI001C589617|nr:DUF4157 domain-containing protein [Aquimarina litoralis]MBW1298396.1 DUF4157 domain-containing protein [Aquimarina litoralis]
MKTQIDKTQQPQNSITPRVASESSNGGTAQLMDNRTSSIDQRQLQQSMGRNEKPIQRKNKTGLPDNLKSGIENLSGYSMDDVKVHYNSSKPAQLQAHAYAQGTDIHLAPGQEKHLPHEAWHVVQQKQGRVKPTRQLKSKVNINDDVGLEKEADVMGARALHSNTQHPVFGLSKRSTSNKPLAAKITENNSRIVLRKKIKKLDNKKSGLYIIGENHNDYDDNIRLKEQEVIYGIMKYHSYTYFREGDLKVKGNFADPIVLRLENALAFSKEDLRDLSMYTETVTEIDAYENNGAKINAGSIINSIDNMTIEPLTKKTKLKGSKLKNIVKAIVAQLHEKGLQNDEGVIRQLCSNDLVWTDIIGTNNFNGVTMVQAELISKLEYEEKKPIGTSDHLFQMNNYLKKNYGRLKGSILEYKEEYENKNELPYEFDLLQELESFLDSWKQANDTGLQFVDKEDGIKANKVYNKFREVLNRQEFNNIRTGENVRKDRSKCMHEAAEELHDKNIIWKVGDKHVSDIINMEKNTGIKTNYYYMDKESFQKKYWSKIKPK